MNFYKHIMFLYIDSLLPNGSLWNLWKSPLSPKKKEETFQRISIVFYTNSNSVQVLLAIQSSHFIGYL